MLIERFRELEERLLFGIKSLYGVRLVSVVVFGSAARGTHGFDSDIDLLIIAKNLPRGRIKRIREFETVEDKIDPFLDSLRKKGINTYISAIIKSPEEADRRSPLFLDMVEDARILFDREDFFSEILERLKKRLKQLGAKRIWRGDTWYWDLKPDYKAGDVFEI